MAQRVEPGDSPDDFPMPPLVARAFLGHVLRDKRNLTKQTCLEPDCGAGHMAKVLKEYFWTVRASGASEYRFGTKRDFISDPLETRSVGWASTNPSFRLGEEFVLKALTVARLGPRFVHSESCVPVTDWRMRMFGCGMSISQRSLDRIGARRVEASDKTGHLSVVAPVSTYRGILLSQNRPHLGQR
jgi:hypothetical protein